MAISRFPLVAAVIALTVVMALPGPLGGAASLRSAAPSDPGVPAAPAHSSADARIQQIEQTLRQDGVPSQYAHLPNIRGADPGRPGQVAPTYDEAPAPMGLADLGLRNVSGTLAPYLLDTSSVTGTASFANAQSVYLDGDGPDMFGLQLNAVATNVTLFGHATYQFWAQDFLSYTSSDGTLTFGDNLWNLSSPTGLISSNALYSHGPNGTMVAPVYYFALGPTFTVHYPFSVTFSLNAATFHNRPAIYFNYTLVASALTASGSFDRVVFNSSFFPPMFPAKVPQFQANGTGVDPYGLPNDLELVLVGNDDGDTTTFFALDAQLSLSTWNASATAYQPVPSAYDAGSDTGETSDGVGVYYNATAGGATLPQAILTVGPSFLYGLWNYSDNPGYRTLSAGAAPTNAFLFVTPGTAYNASIAQWVPTFADVSGSEAIAFPNEGNYHFDWFLSDYRPVHRSLDPAANSTTKVVANMVRATTFGVYTPLLAWGDSELASISSSGNGTAGSPYQIEANQYHAIGPEFGALNDFFFPVFPGILLVDTNASVRVTPPSFAITYPPSVAANLSAAGLPSTNHLQLEFWNVTNMTLEAAPGISGWLSSDLGFFPVGAVILWDSTGNLVAGNTFYDQGISLALYGGSQNTVWGNSFLNSTAPATNASAVENSGNNTTGIFESESGDLIYNNYFSLPAPAYTPTLDPLSCQIVCEPAVYTDRWNVSSAPANTTNVVLGTNLSGSIIGTTYQGGNYWSNYGTPANPLGVLPYNDGGRITSGGDYVPLVRSPAYLVAVNELGLGPGAVWGVEVQGVAYRTNQSVLTLYAPNGTFGFSVILPVGYTAPALGNFTVNGTGTEVTIVFTPLVALAFVESGLVPGWNWNVTIGPANLSEPNETENSSNGSIVFELVPGSYSFGVGSYGYNASPSSGTVDLPSGGTSSQSIVFSILPILTFEESGLRSGTAWTIEITGGPAPENFTSVATSLVLSIFDLPTGAYSWTASAANYTATPGAGSGNSTEPAVVPLSFQVISGTLAVSVNVPGVELWINSSEFNLSNGSFRIAEAPGTYPIVVVASGYATYYNNVTVTSGKTTALPIALTALPATGPGGISYLGWAIIAVLAVAAAAGLLLAARSRRGRPPPPVAPFAGTSASAVRPPWQEDPADTSVEPPQLPPR